MTYTAEKLEFLGAIERVKARVKWLSVASLAAVAFLTVSPADATEVITGTYTQDFNNLSSGLPANWTVRTGSGTTALGTTVAVATGTTAWSSSTGQFANYASTNISGTSTAAQQGADLDRALGVRQTGSFGDSGASFNFSFSTIDATVSQLSLDLDMLSVQSRSTTWTIQYGIGSTPSSWLTLGTYTDTGVFGATPVTYTTSDFGAALDNQSAVWFRVVALTVSSGTGTRDTFGIDNFTLSATYTPPASDSLYWSAGTWGTTASGTGGNGSWADASGGWDSAKKAVFAGNAGTVTVGTVTAGSGIEFDTDGYTLTGGSIALTGTVGGNLVTVTTGSARISSSLIGTAGLTKSGAGKLVLDGNNSGLSGVIGLTAGTLAVGSANALGSSSLSLAGGTFTSADGTARTIGNNAVFDGSVNLGEAGTGKLTFTGSIGFGGATINTIVDTVFSGTTSGGVTKGGSANLEFVGTNHNLGGLSVTSGTAIIDAGSSVTMSSGGITAGSGAGLLVSGTLLYQSATSWVAPVGTVEIANGGWYVHNSGAGTSALSSANFKLDDGSTFEFLDAGTPAVNGRTFTNLIIAATTGTSYTIGGASAFTVKENFTVGQNVTLTESGTGADVFLGNVTVNGIMTSAKGFTIAGINPSKTLEVNGAITLATGKSITIASSGTIKGSGAIHVGDVNVADGAFIAPGSATGGLLSLDSLVLSGNATSVYSIAGTTRADAITFGVGTYNAIDSLVLTLDGTVKVVLDGYTPVLGDVFTLITWVDLVDNGVTFDFSSAVLDTGLGWDTSNFETNGTISVIAIPEPSVTGLLFAGGVGLLVWRKVRRRVAVGSAS